MRPEQDVLLSVSLFAPRTGKYAPEPPHRDVCQHQVGRDIGCEKRPRECAESMRGDMTSESDPPTA